MYATAPSHLVTSTTISQDQTDAQKVHEKHQRLHLCRVKSEQVAQQQEAGMAVEDKVQAAVERHVTAACVGHAQELEAVRQQLQQTLDRRAQV